MMLKVVLGQGDWQVLNGNCHFVHLRLLIQSKCPTWPEGGVLDLCDLETGGLMGLHMLEPWDMAGQCLSHLDTQKKIFTPVALTVEKGTIQAIEPMLDSFAEQFPELKAALDALIQTQIREDSSKKSKSPGALSGSQKDSKTKAKAAKKAKEKRAGKK